MLWVFWTASKTFLKKRVSRKLAYEKNIKHHILIRRRFHRVLKPLHVIFYRPFDRSMALWIINEFLKLSVIFPNVLASLPGLIELNEQVEIPVWGLGRSVRFHNQLNGCRFAWLRAKDEWSRGCIKPMIHGSTFVEQQMLQLLFNKCWTVYHVMLDVEICRSTCWKLLNENRAWLYSVQQVALTSQQVATMFNICWSTKVERCWTVYHLLKVCNPLRK